MADLRLFKVVRGVVHLTTGDMIRVAGPGEIVCDSEDSPILSTARVAALIEDGVISFDLQAELQSPPLSDADRTSAETALASARGMNRGSR